MKSRICLIRHSITEANQKMLYYGYADIPLAAEGETLVKQLAADGVYPDAEGADLYTTGMLRTEQTLALIYGEREHEVIDSLREMNFGSFEMKSHAELKTQEAYQIWHADQTGTLEPPEGESIVGFAQRIIGGFEELKKKHALRELALRHHEQEAVSIMVCHGGTIAAILDHCFPGQKKIFYEWIPDPGHGYMLYLEDGVVVRQEQF